MSSHTSAFPNPFNSDPQFSGLTKREYIATVLMAAMIANTKMTANPDAAIEYADSLLAKLEATHVG